MRKTGYFVISRKSLGDFFIFSAGLILLYALFPVLSAYFFPTFIKPLTPQEKKFSIAIPKIHAVAPVIANVDPWNESVYQQALKHGVAHAKGTGLPGDNKTIFIFAHANGNPWEISRINTIFFRLHELENNDTITLSYLGKEYVYTVTSKKVVLPTDITYLTHTSTDQLILQTCTPLGTSLKRLLVFAAPVRNMLPQQPGLPLKTSR